MEMCLQGVSPSSCMPQVLIPRESKHLEKEMTSSVISPLAVLWGFILNSSCNYLMSEKEGDKNQNENFMSQTKTSRRTNTELNRFCARGREGKKVNTFLQHIPWHKSEQLLGTICFFRHNTSLEYWAWPHHCFAGHVNRTVELPSQFSGFPTETVLLKTSSLLWA